MRPVDLGPKEASGMYLAQRKFNGKRCVSLIESRTTVHLGNRHGGWYSQSKNRQLRSELLRLKLPNDGSHRLDGELLGSGILVLFDVLQIGQPLIGTKQTERLLLLDRICGNPTGHSEIAHEGVPLALQVSDHIWLAERWFSDFRAHFDECIDHDLIEGLVLRESDSMLDNYGAVEYEVDWQIRVRKPSKSYRH
jgi:hypothetical protein